MQQRSKPETLRLQAVVPALTVKDIRKSLAWYRDVLGFFVAEEMEREGKLMGVILRAGAAELLIGQDDFAKGRDRVKGQGLRLFCTTRQDIDELARAVEARGGELAQPPKDQPWGARDFAVVDPDGFNLSISTVIER